MLAFMAGGAEVSEPPATSLQPGWVVMKLPEGAELRYLPLAVTLADYPKMALRMGAEGTSVLALQLDVSGRIISCTTARSSGWSELDAKACLLYRTRGRLELRGATEPVRLQAPVKWMLVD
jgi:TonB family protein